MVSIDRRTVSSSPIVACSIAFLAIACGGDGDKPEVAAPRVGTTFVVIGAAGGGRALNPRDISVKRATDVPSIEVPGSGNLEVEMFFAGIREEDLPRGLTPDRLEFVLPSDPGARPFPPIVSPHVLEEASAPGTSAVFVPLEEAGLSDDEEQQRKERLDHLLSGVALRDPCSAPPSPIRVNTIRSQASAITTMRALSNGDVWIGFAATSTAIVGVVPKDSETLRIAGVRTGSVAIQDGETAAITTFGERESQDAEGQPTPAEIGVFRGAVLGHVGIWSPSRGYYVDDTPRALMSVPAVIAGFEHLPRSGVDSLCMWGSVLGQVGPSGTARAGIWCRPETSHEWRSIGEVDKGQRFTMMLARQGLPLLAVDYGGAVYQRLSDDDWTFLARPPINEGCDPLPCAAMPIAAEAPETQPGVLAVVAGAKAEVSVIRGTSIDDLRIDTLRAVADATFSDERRDGRYELLFEAALFTPDRALWLGSTGRFLIRVEPDLASATRVCLPDTAKPVSGLAALPEGKLVIGMSPATVGFGTWQRP